MSKEQLLKKIKALKQRAATDGEREAAAAAEKRLIEKYDLEALENEQVEKIYWFSWSVAYEKKLLHQIVWSIKPDVSYIYKCNKYKTQGFMLFEDEAAQVEYEYEFYKRLFANDLKTLYTAFLCKHDIFPQNHEAQTSNDETEKEDAEKIYAMMMGLSDDSLYKALPDGGKNKGGAR